MKTAIMQPYFFPYIGYFQLINAVDQYVVYDDVNYIKNGWINRNRCLVNGESKLFTLSVDGASSYKFINETMILENKLYKTREKLLKTIKMAYAKAPYFNVVYDLLLEVIGFEENNISIYNTNSISAICNYLNIGTKILLSSSMKKDYSLSAQDKVVSICNSLSTRVYINPIGGKSLYDWDYFKKMGIDLFFLKTNAGIKYHQYGDIFVPNLSIIDVLMFNSISEVSTMLDMHTLEN
jgi:hypothetical protein